MQYFGLEMTDFGMNLGRGQKWKSWAPKSPVRN